MSTIFEVYVGDHSSLSILEVDKITSSTDPLLGASCREEITQVLLEEVVRDLIVSLYMTSPRAAYHEGLTRKIELLNELWPSHPPVEVIGSHTVRIVIRPEVSRPRMHAALGILRSGNGMGADWHWMNDYASLVILEAAEVDEGDFGSKDYYGSFDFIFNILSAEVLYKTCRGIDWKRFDYGYLVPVYRSLSEDSILNPAPTEMIERLHKFICSKRSRVSRLTWGDIRGAINQFKRDNRKGLCGDGDGLITTPTDILILQYIQSQQRSPS